MKTNDFDFEWIALAKSILETGNDKEDRTGTGTLSKFGEKIKIDLREGFPLLTLKKLHCKSIFHEMLWFLGSTDEKYKKFGVSNIKYLVDNGVRIWNEWCWENYCNNHHTIEERDLSLLEFGERIKESDTFAMRWGSIGKGYGTQWNQWESFDGEMLHQIDQVKGLIDTLRTNPDSRRILISAWNVGELHNMLLPPCHLLNQWYTEDMPYKDRCEYASTKGIISKRQLINGISGEMLTDLGVPSKYLSMQMYQRSCDLGLGSGFNVAQYALLVGMVAQVVGMVPKTFDWVIGDVHIYKNHIEQMTLISNRPPKQAPSILFNTNKKEIRDFRFEDFMVVGYDPHPHVKMEVSI